MPNNSVDTTFSLGVGETLNYRYQRISTGVWSGWFTASTPTFVFSTSDPQYTNYVVEVYKTCIGGGGSSTTTFTTNRACPCNILNVYNAVASSCNPSTNTHSVTFLVDYTCMKNDVGLTTSVFRVEIDSVVSYINPNSASGTQSITINNIVSNGSTKVISVTCVAS